MAERRRSERRALPREEIAIVHDFQYGRPATVVDFSTSGALLTLMDIAGLPDCQAKVDDCVELSLQTDESFFYVRVRIVRRGPQFLAVEFVDGRPEIIEQIEAKVRRLSEVEGEPRTHIAGLNV